MRLIDAWHRKFGPAYRQLQIGYRYLRACKQVDFDRLDAESRIQRIRAEEKIRRQVEFERRIFDRVRAHYEEFREDIGRCLREAESALELIFPDFAAESENADDLGPSLRFV